MTSFPWRPMILVPLACLLAIAPSRATGPFLFSYDTTQHRWDLSNGVVHAAFQLSSSGQFGLIEADNPGGNVWSAPTLTPSSPISFTLGSTVYSAATSFQLISQHVESPNSSTERQVIVLEDLNKTAEIQVDLEMYLGQPVLRHWLTITNLTASQKSVTALNLVPYGFKVSPGQTFQEFRVQQWSATAPVTNYGAAASALADGTAVSFTAGSGGTHCGWFALADNASNGLFAGWEFDGEVTASGLYQSSSATLQTGVAVNGIFHAIPAGQSLVLPAGFIGLFNGSWDQAAAATQKFVEAVLAVPMPQNFPYMAWDSWAYDTAVDETTLRANADIAATMGVELFIVDLGWARQIGDWEADPVKFPSGMRALSDYVHSKGMKFGLHFALAEAMATSPVLQQNPDWTSSTNYNYFGAESLCLSHQPVQAWLIQQTLRMIDNYNIDWILQDGQNMVKKCTKTTHTHDYRDSNYSNAVNGIDYVVSQVRAQRPNVMWENCEDGGSLMTFNMVKNYVTSITSDAVGDLLARQGVYGVTYPFSPRYADTYMIENPDSTYVTRSYMFGGPWHLMNALPTWTPAEVNFTSSEIAVYKKIRSRIATGTVYHVTSVAANGRADALESFNPADGTAIAIVLRNGESSNTATILLQGLNPATTYLVSFQTATQVLSMTGAQLASPGVKVSLPQAQSGEIVYVTPE